MAQKTILCGRAGGFQLPFPSKTSRIFLRRSGLAYTGI